VEPLAVITFSDVGCISIPVAFPFLDQQEFSSDNFVTMAIAIVPSRYRLNANARRYLTKKHMDKNENLGKSFYRCV
jgi:hypothetical protein